MRTLLGISQLLDFQIIDLIFAGWGYAKLDNRVQRHRIDFIGPPRPAVRIIGAEKDLLRAYRVINELDELGANRPRGIVENFLEVDIWLLPACRISLAAA